MHTLNLTAADLLFRCALIGFCVLCLSCSIQASIPTVSDPAIERLVRDEAARIVAVSEDKGRLSEYEVLLSDFPRKDILGMSVGKRRIYISHQLGKLAQGRESYRWLLRQTLAHEIAHETAGHAEQNGVSAFNRFTSGRGVTAADIGLPWNVWFRHYSLEKELEADLKGLSYWRKLHWDCRIWVGILEQFRQHNYSGDIFHPTGERLKQARGACRSEENDVERARQAQSS